MFMKVPQDTELGKALDSLREMNQEHEDVERWMAFLESALDDMDRDDGWSRLLIVELFLSQSLLRHLAFEERAVFPALADLEQNQDLDRVLAQLVDDHKEIRRAVGRFSLLTREYQGPPPDEHKASIRETGMAVHVALTAHAMREAEFVLPFLLRNPPPAATPPDFEPLPW